MKDFLSGLVLVFTVIALGILAIAGLDAIMPPREQRQSPMELNFRASCEAVKGNAVWNGRHMECLK